MSLVRTDWTTGGQLTHMARVSSLKNDKKDQREITFNVAAAAAAAKWLQLCPTLWDPIDSSPPGSPIPGILQARTLEWVAISFSNAWKWKVKVRSLSCVPLLATLWTAAYQAPPSMGFSRQEYWGGVHCLLHSMRLDVYKNKERWMLDCFVCTVITERG